DDALPAPAGVHARSSLPRRAAGGIPIRARSAGLRARIPAARLPLARMDPPHPDVYGAVPVTFRCFSPLSGQPKVWTDIRLVVSPFTDRLEKKQVRPVSRLVWYVVEAIVAAPGLRPVSPWVSVFDC